MSIIKGKKEKDKVYKVLADKICILELNLGQERIWSQVYFDCGQEWPNKIEAQFDLKWNAFMFLMRLRALGVKCSGNWPQLVQN